MNLFALPSQPFFVQVLTLNQNLVTGSDMGDLNISSCSFCRQQSQWLVTRTDTRWLWATQPRQLWPPWSSPTHDATGILPQILTAIKTVWCSSSCHSGKLEGMEVVAKVFLSPWGTEAMCFLPSIVVPKWASLRFSLSSRILHTVSVGSEPALFFMLLQSSWWCSLLMSLMPIGHVHLTNERFSCETLWCPHSPDLDSSWVLTVNKTFLFLALRCWQEMQRIDLHYSQVTAQPLILGLRFILPVPRIANLGAWSSALITCQPLTQMQIRWNNR